MAALAEPLARVHAAARRALGDDALADVVVVQQVLPRALVEVAAVREHRVARHVEHGGHRVRDQDVGVGQRLAGVGDRRGDHVRPPDAQLVLQVLHDVVDPQHAWRLALAPAIREHDVARAGPHPHLLDPSVHLGLLARHQVVGDACVHVKLCGERLEGGVILLDVCRPEELQHFGLVRHRISLHEPDALRQHFVVLDDVMQQRLPLAPKVGQLPEPHTVRRELRLEAAPRVFALVVHHDVVDPRLLREQ